MIAFELQFTLLKRNSFRRPEEFISKLKSSKHCIVRLGFKCRKSSNQSIPQGLQVQHTPLSQSTSFKDNRLTASKQTYLWQIRHVIFRVYFLFWALTLFSKWTSQNLHVIHFKGKLPSSKCNKKNITGQIYIFIFLHELLTVLTVQLFSEQSQPWAAVNKNRIRSTFTTPYCLLL